VVKSLSSLLVSKNFLKRKDSMIHNAAKPAGIGENRSEEGEEDSAADAIKTEVIAGSYRNVYTFLYAHKIKNNIFYNIFYFTFLKNHCMPALHASNTYLKVD